MQTQEKTHWKKYYNYDYLGSYSISGSDLILTIKGIKKENVIGANGKKDECIVARFSEDVKPMIVNKTNCKIIEKIYGTPFIEEWVGKKIQIYSARVSAFGDEVDALRIRPKVPQAEKPVLQPGTKQWDNAVSHLQKGGKLSDIEKHYTVSENLKETLMEGAI